jgi:adenosine kinase
VTKKNTQRPRVVIITQGTLPTVTAVATASGAVETKEYPVVEIPKEKINDTNGAGCVIYLPFSFGHPPSPLELN